jgi:hypothetical protein
MSGDLIKLLDRSGVESPFWWDALWSVGSALGPILQCHHWGYYISADRSTRPWRVELATYSTGKSQLVTAEDH